MKKVILTLLISIIGLIDVNALQVGGVEYYTPSELELYNNTGLNATTRVSSSWLSITGTGPTWKHGYVSTTTGGYGASWCFNTGGTLLANYIYTVQMVVQNGSGLGFTTVSNNNYDMLRVGYSLDDASLHSNSTNIIYFGVTYDSNGVYVNDIEIVNSAYVMTYLFSTNINGNYICLPFRHLQNTSNDDEMFYGAKIDVIGQNDLVTNASLNNAITNSGLASATSVSQVQNSINQVQQEMNDIDNTLKEDHDYNNNPSETIDGKDNIDDMTQAEENLMNNIDLDGASDVNVVINPYSSNFIWNIVNRLREINPAIITLMTSILGIGIFKLILNR